MKKNEIVTTGNTIDHVKGKLISFDGLNEKPIALIDKSVFGSLFDNEHMIMPTYHMDYREKKMVRGKDNTRALETTSINVMPRAVASSQAFINFFFRGQIDASLSANHTHLVIKNVSKINLVHNSKLLTYKKGGKFTLYVEKSGVNNFVGTYTLNSDIKAKETRNINIGNIIESKGIRTGAKITVVYDGNIGDDMGGYNSYDIGMRGLSADVFTVQEKPKDCTDSSLSKSIQKVKSSLGNSSNCVKFPDIEFQKTIWIDDNNANCQGAYIKYKNAALWGIGGKYDGQIDANELINYFTTP